ncbi:hypothetical protein D7S86_27115 [Pararobbsia silviterrae]|uniref:Uncharacterized protein n=2 Tax=Pararobbsia silviterrae TaxID=1792498 RepID=A0A494XAV3_9BURK|nr:hypothetical protein D7S86_27115 [Pararobbsia silviterrae]
MEFIKGGNSDEAETPSSLTAIDAAEAAAHTQDQVAATMASEAVAAPKPRERAPKPPVEPQNEPQDDPLPIPRRRSVATTPFQTRLPVDLHEELRDFWKATDIPMSEVIIAGTRDKLAALKKKYGLE